MSRFTTPRRTLALAGVLCTASFGVAACGSDDNSSSSGSTPAAGTSTPAKSSTKAGKVAVLLPDSKSSVRWETQDRKYLGEAFKAAGIDYTIVNAEGDPAAQRTQAEQAITNGAKVLLLVDLDPGSGSAIIANAHKSGVKVIDYDRLTLGGAADYYVSFDNSAVGKLQGDGLVQCLDAAGASKPVVAELNGSPTDNNATLFAQGYDGVLNPLYESGKYAKGPNQSVPEWDNQKALTIFEQMLQKTNNKINGVLAANDGLANAAISALKARKLPAIPVTGQDATAQGIQHILAGDQCMTVYKAVKAEAEAASKLAIALAKGETPTTTETTDNKGEKTPSVLLKPIAVTKDNIKDTVIKDGFLSVGEVCTGKFAAACTKAGIS